MPLELSRCEDDDFPRAFEILSRAFGSEMVFINGFWPQHQTGRGRADGAERLRIWDREDSWTTFMKVINTDVIDKAHPRGLMIAMAKWNIFDKEIPPEKDIDGPWWDDGRGDKAYGQALWRAFLAGRRQAIRESDGNLVWRIKFADAWITPALDIMVVDPDYQGLGAGKMLMDWGIQQADRLDVEVRALSVIHDLLRPGKANSWKSVTEATAAGRPLYEKFDFEFVRTRVLVVPEPWMHLKQSSHAFMKRPRRSQLNSARPRDMHAP